MNKRVLVFLSFLLVVFIVYVLSSCATVISGSSQEVEFNSEPSGAKVYVDGRNTYKETPCRVYVKRKAPANKTHKYTLKKEGYDNFEYSDKAGLNPVTIGNLFFTGAFWIGVGIDWLSGSIYQYDKEVEAILNPEKNYIVDHQSSDEGPEPKEKEETSNMQEKTIVKNSETSEEFTLTSDVDQNIPETGKTYPYRFALIIGNEDYSSYQLSLHSEVDVEFARNDARAFRNYATKTLGIPERNVVFLTDATRGQMGQAISKMNLIAKNAYGKAEIFFFYAGHGLPHEVTQEPYLVPVDVSGKDIESAIKLKDVYAKLTEYSSKRVTVFLDACFSGGARNQGLLAARAVKIKPRKDDLEGNLVVFSASKGIQSALPFREKKHGFFTYYLLKKIQNTRGELSYNDLSNYLKEKVGLESVLLNDKEQNPQVNVSPSVKDEWETWKFLD
jgi:hypothetical protein